MDLPSRRFDVKSRNLSPMAGGEVDCARTFVRPGDITAVIIRMI
jgi:hypothetical protein